MSSSRIPYFDFYPGDFMRGVRGLTAAEVGIYTMLLCRIYEENGPVEYHPVRLSAYCGVRESTLTKAVDRLVVLGRIEVHDGAMSDARAMKEIGIREAKLKNSSRAGKASAEKRHRNQGQGPTPVQQPFNHLDRDTEEEKKEDTNVSLSAEPTVRGPSFDEFWNVWPLAKTNKQAARQAFTKLSQQNRTDATRCAAEWGERWAAENPTLKHIHPSTYLNKRRWEDERPSQPTLTLISGGPYVQPSSHSPRLSNADAQRLAITVAGRTRRAPDPDWL